MSGSRAQSHRQPEPVDGRMRVGRLGEACAARWYERRGYEVLARNWRCREGEIDLILRRADELVFCEVKTRLGSRFSGFEAVTVTKQRRIRIVALRYLAATGRRSPHLRFDVAVIDRNAQVEVVEAAF